MKSSAPADKAALADAARRGAIAELMVSEHALLDSLLREAVRGDVEAYRQFRLQNQ